MTLKEKIMKPYTALGRDVTEEDIRRAINKLATTPSKFQTNDLACAIFPSESDATKVERMEALNRLMQRLRKLGLASYQDRRWRLKRGAWDILQHASSRIK